MPPTFVDEPSIEFVSKYKFSEGLAAVEVRIGESESAGTKWGFIDKKGSFVIAPTYLMALDFSEGLAAVQVEVEKGKAAKWGFIDQKGNMIIVPTYSEALSFSGGLAPVKTGGGLEAKDKWGFIDHEGHLKIVPTYSDAPDLYDFKGHRIHTAPYFSEGLAAIQMTNGKLGFIDTNGNLAIKTRFPFKYFTDTFIHSSFNRSQYDESVYEYEFGEPTHFSDGLFPIQTNRRWGYIDKSGNLLILPKFDVASNFQEGLAAVGVGHKTGFINRHGKYINPLRFRYASDFSNGLALVFFKRFSIDLESENTDRRQHTLVYGYVDRKGHVVFRGTNVFISEIQGGDLQEVLDFPRQVKISVMSSPAKANVYLIPWTKWDEGPSMSNDERLTLLLPKLLPDGETPYESEINQQVYMVVIEYQGKKIPRRLDAHDKKVNRVDVTFDNR